MNLCIDQGNSSTKVAIFKQYELVENFYFETFDTNEVSNLLRNFQIKNTIFSSVSVENNEIIDFIDKQSNFLIKLNYTTQLPITNLYKTPETLGNDRLAAIVGAATLKPNNDILVIDAGTAITYDFIDAFGNYVGGNISSGLSMRLKALHEFTKKLPLVKAEIESPFLGDTTNSAILSGALNGIIFEMDGYINTLKIKYPQLSIFLTGGSTFYFDTKLKNAIFAEKNLVLIGLNRILQYNVQK